jgi:hypothetical protein
MSKRADFLRFLFEDYDITEAQYGGLSPDKKAGLAIAFSSLQPGTTIV